MSHIASLLPSSNVVLDMPAADKKAVFEHAAGLLEGKTGVKRGQILDSLLARERMDPPGSEKVSRFPTAACAVCVKQSACSCARVPRSLSRRRTICQ